MPGRVYQATWGRLFAAFYDAGLRATEEAGLREKRRQTLAPATGRTLELGAGTGLNLDHYPNAVTELVLSEPSPHMARKLKQRLGGHDRSPRVVVAGAESLPFDDDEFDTVAETLVLCTVPDPEAALREVARVLKPGGRFLFLEHVRAEEPGLSRWQDRLHGPWKLFADGCHCNRATSATLEASPLRVEELAHDEMPKAPPLVRPLILGSARAAA